MATATIQFHYGIQDSQNYGGDGEHMVSRVFLTLETEGRTYADLTVDIKQSVGESFEGGVLEVSQPSGYDGSLNYREFRDAVEAYYLRLVGSQGRGIHVSGAANIRMRDSVFEYPETATFEYSDQSAAW